jgi:monovalent cation/hydrogen antiporter
LPSRRSPPPRSPPFPIWLRSTGVSEEVLIRLTNDYHEHLALVHAPQRRHLGYRPGRSQGQTGPQHEEVEAILDGQGLRAQAQPRTRALQDDEYTPLARNEEYTRLRIAMLDRKREVLLRLRRTGTIDDTIARHLQTSLDIEELRLTGVAPLE